MKRIQSFVFSAVVALVFFGCKSSQIAVSSPSFEAVILTPAKKGRLSEEALKTWSH